MWLKILGGGAFRRVPQLSWRRLFCITTCIVGPTVHSVLVTSLSHSRSLSFIRAFIWISMMFCFYFFLPISLGGTGRCRFRR